MLLGDDNDKVVTLKTPVVTKYGVKGHVEAGYPEAPNNDDLLCQQIQ